ncbi:unnamed protein product [Schistosoma curassoni]|uniref:Uncharacterized protein n=1 Tax=Schistosoma curassoni TaxID=6186 RepID=A0A183L751_9TREM|nr:unnamed protein product [Schistosoma curassoni]
MDFVNCRVIFVTLYYLSSFFKILIWMVNGYSRYIVYTQF